MAIAREHLSLRRSDLRKVLGARLIREPDKYAYVSLPAEVLSA